jgi:hypothetical protein
MDTHALKIKYYKQTHTLGYHPKKAKQNFDLRNTIQKTIINELDHWFFFPEHNLSIQAETINFSDVNNLRKS